MIELRRRSRRITSSTTQFNHQGDILAINLLALRCMGVNPGGIWGGRNTHTRTTGQGGYLYNYPPAPTSILYLRLLINRFEYMCKINREYQMKF